MSQTIYFTYHRTEQMDFDWLKLSLSSVKRHCCAKVVVVTDNMPTQERDIIRSKYKADIKKILPSEWENRRTLCRLEQTAKIVRSLSSENSELIQSDIDVLFLDNPFKAFDEQDFGVGVTVRMYSYHVPVNSGLVFFRIDDNVKKYTSWAVEQVKNPTWWPYMMKRSSRDNVDWGCDQDIINAIYRNDGWVKYNLGFYIKDVGYKYNYCAGTDVLDFEPAIHLMKRALDVKDYPVLHFKGERLKQLIYDPCLEKYR